MKIKQIQSLTRIQWWWIFVAYWRLWVVWSRIKLKQGAWLKQKICILPSASTMPSASTKAKWLANHEAVRLAARLHFFSMACLPRSIVLADMLCQQGEKAMVMIGVSKAESQFASHAWVEVNGSIVGEPEGMSLRFIPIKW